MSQLMTRDHPLRPALKAIQGAGACRTDERPEAWWSDRRGMEGEMDVRHALDICRHHCPSRAMCAAWAFLMEDFGIWGGYTEQQRVSLKRNHREQVGALVMIVKSRITTSDGKRGTLRPGRPTEVDDAYGAQLVASGLADEVLAGLDKAAPAASRRSGTFGSLSERAWNPGDPAILPPLPESAYGPDSVPLDDQLGHIGDSTFTTAPESEFQGTVESPEQ